MSGKLIIVFGGDSITGGAGSWAFQSVGVTSKGDDGQIGAQAASSYKNGSIQMLNLALGGSHLSTSDPSDLVVIAPAYADPIVAHKAQTPSGLTARKYLFVDATGSNDGAIGGLASASAYATANATAAVARRTNGFDLCAMTTLIPRNDGVMLEGNRAAYNALLTDSSWRSTHGIDYVIDLASETTMGNPATCSNVTYFSDGTHPTTAGHALLASIASSVWTTILATI